jgi:hypothetical protein
LAEASDCKNETVSWKPSKESQLKEKNLSLSCYKSKKMGQVKKADLAINLMTGTGTFEFSNGAKLHYKAVTGE